MKKLSKPMGIVLMSCFVISNASAEGHHRGGHHKKGAAFMNPKILERVAEKINLDEATLEAIKEKIYRSKKAAIEWSASLKAKKLDLRHALDGQSPDRAKIMVLIEESGTLHVKLKKHRIGLMLEIRSMLTPEQIKKVKGFRREFKGKHQRRRKVRKNRAGGQSKD